MTMHTAQAPLSAPSCRISRSEWMLFPVPSRYMAPELIACHEDVSRKGALLTQNSFFVPNSRQPSKAYPASSS